MTRHVREREQERENEKPNTHGISGHISKTDKIRSSAQLAFTTRILSLRLFASTLLAAYEQDFSSSSGRDTCQPMTLVCGRL